MALTRKERLLQAILDDNPAACGCGVTREERMLSQVAKKMCDNDVLEGGGSSMPEGTAPNQMLVTDAEGVKKWDERTHYAKDVKTEIMHVYVDPSDMSVRFLTDNYSAIVAGQHYTAKYKTENTSYEVDATSNDGSVVFSFEHASGYTYTLSDNGDGYSILQSPESTSPEGFDISYGDRLYIYRVDAEVKQLDEKFIPDTIARKADVGGMPIYYRGNGEQNRDLLMSLIKAAQPFMCMEPNNDDSMQVRHVTNFTANKQFEGEDGEMYPASITAYATNSFGELIVAYEIADATEDEVQAVWDAWSAMAKDLA